MFARVPGVRPILCAAIKSNETFDRFNFCNSSLTISKIVLCFAKVFYNILSSAFTCFTSFTLMQCSEGAKDMPQISEALLQI